MKCSFVVISLAILALSLTGCEKNSLGTIDSPKDIPQLTNALVTPDTIYIDNLIPVGGQYQISSTIRVNAPSTINQIVVATLIRPNSASTLQQVTLSVTSANTYSGQIQFSIPRSQTGRYRIQLVSRTSEGLQSNAIEVPLKLGRRNSLPQLLNVTMPDSIRAPLLSTDTLKVQFTATVSDSDGLADIREVSFRRISPPDPTKFFMKDDGSLDPPVSIGGIPLRSGDDIAGDGKYSFLIPVLSTTTRRTNVFLFQCVDSFGDTSRSIVDSLAIR